MLYFFHILCYNNLLPDFPRHTEVKNLKKKNKKYRHLSNEETLRRAAIFVLALYVILTVSFYFLAGEQLRIRQSRGEISAAPADTGTVELVDGSSVEQIFSPNIQRLESVSVQWGTYYRENSGTVTMALYDTRDNSLLMSQSFGAADIEEGGFTVMTASEPIEGLYGAPLLLRLTADSEPGSAVSPLMNSQSAVSGGVLTVDGEERGGTLCFSAGGTDYIWTGLHYWQFVIAGFLMIAALIFHVRRLVKNGRRSYIANAILAIKKYTFLIKQLVIRDFKTKYKRSVLGVFWSFLNPLLMMTVQYILFSTLFKSNIENFAVYLLTGVVMFNFFSESSSMSLVSIISNASLITKVYMPKYIYPLTRILSSLINLAISLVPLLLVCIISGVRFTPATVLALYFMLCLVVFCLGLGMLLGASMVFFRDTQFLWNVLSMIWMYATPIFYPESIIPAKIMPIYQLNPLYNFLKNARLCIMSGISPEPRAYLECFVIAILMLLVGAFVFKKNQDKFVLYL